MIEYRAFGGDSELEEQRSLFLEAFPEQRGESPATREHYHWKFRSFPGEPSAYEFVASAEGKLQGYYAAIPFRYKVGDRELRCGMVCDVMTHPRMQGKGIFTGLGRYALGEMQKANVDFVSGYPIRPAVIPGHLKVGWRVAFDLPMYIKVLRADALLKKYRLGFLAPLVNGALRVLHALWPARADSSLSIHESVDLMRLGEEPIQKFIARFAEKIPNFLVKDPEFYRWRLGAPASKYRIIEVRRGEICVGVAVVRPTVIDGLPALAVLDFMVDTHLPGATKTLHAAIARCAREARCEVIVAMLSGHRARFFAFSANLYLRSPFKFQLILKSLRDDIDVHAMSLADHWHLMWIDSDDL